MVINALFDDLEDMRYLLRAERAAPAQYHAAFFLPAVALASKPSPASNAAISRSHLSLLGVRKGRHVSRAGSVVDTALAGKNKEPDHKEDWIQQRRWWRLTDGCMLAYWTRAPMFLGMYARCKRSSLKTRPPSATQAIFTTTQSTLLHL